MKKIFLFLFPVFIAACVELTPAGSHVKLIKEDQSTQVAECQALGTISVSSEDALRNSAAALSGDTAIMSHRDVGTTSIIHGKIFRCSVEANKHPGALTTETEKIESDSLRKSNLCHSKGGSWISNQCVIPIE